MDSFFDIFTELSLDGGATWSPCDAPMRVAFAPAEIDVSTPGGSAIADGSDVTVNATITSTVSIDIAGFVIRNPGTGPLTGMGFTFDGPGASSFSVPNPPAGPLPPGGVTAFKVAFSSSTPGTRTATLHITTNDADEPSFDITLSARALMPDEDDDADGIPNDEELSLAACGFDPLVSSATETDFLRDNGFFRYQRHARAGLGPSGSGTQSATGQFHLRLGIRESPTLSGWSALTGFSSSVDPGTGLIDLTIPPGGSSTRFFQVFGQEP